MCFHFECIAFQCPSELLRKMANVPPALPSAEKVVGFSFASDLCRYRLESGRWALATELPFSSVRSFWLERSTKPVKPPPPKAPARMEEDVDIIGLTKDHRGLCVAIRHLDDPRIYVMPCADARKRFPVQLSLFYEAHIKFDSV